MPDPTANVGISREEFLRDYGEALAAGHAALFVGAGASRAAGFVDWKGLLKDFADELGLDLEIEHDLVAVAQYHLNHEKQNRTRLQQKLIDEFGSPPTNSLMHERLARLPVSTYWTSNYDALIENALTNQGRVPVVRKNSETLTSKSAEPSCEVLKLHGDLADPDSVILTRDDYEEYRRKFPMFRERLQSDLVSKSFLFVGFSFADPHLDFLLGEIRASLGPDVGTHYAITRREPAERPDGTANYQAIRQALQIADLERYGIQTLLVDDYDDIPDVLEQLRLRYLRRHVFVSGAVHDFSPQGTEWFNSVARLLGSLLMSEGYNLVSGFGHGIGPMVLSGALAQLFTIERPKLDRRLVLRPFPYDQPDPELYTRYRQSMLALAGSSVFIAGNKLQDGATVLSPGVREEYELSRTIGSYPLPVGCSGSVAAELWGEVDAEFDVVFPEGTPREAWNVLNDAAGTPEAVVDALIELLNFLRPRIADEAAEGETK